MHMLGSWKGRCLLAHERLHLRVCMCVCVCVCVCVSRHLPHAYWGRVRLRLSDRRPRGTAWIKLAKGSVVKRAAWALHMNCHPHCAHWLCCCCCCCCWIGTYQSWQRYATRKGHPSAAATLPPFPSLPPPPPPSSPSSSPRPNRKTLRRRRHIPEVEDELSCGDSEGVEEHSSESMKSVESVESAPAVSKSTSITTPRIHVRAATHIAS
jgi:hypothetical protein